MNNSRFIVAATIFCFAGFLQHICKADSGKVDSLLQLVETAKSDKERVRWLNEAAGNTTDKEQKIGYAERALKLAERIEDSEAIGWSYFYMAEVYEIPDIDTAIYFYKKSIEYFRKVKDLEAVAGIYNILGIVNKNKGAYQTAINYYSEALKVVQEIQDKGLLGKIYNNIGLVYLHSGSYERAIDYFVNSLKIREEINDDKGYAITLGNLGNLYYNQKQYEKAIDNYKKANELLQTLGDLSYAAHLLHNIGAIHIERKNYEEALRYVNRAFDIYNQQNNQLGIAMSLNSIANIHTQLANYKQSLQNGLSALEILIKLNNKSHLVTTYIEIGTTYLKLENYNEAYNHFIKGLTLAKDIGNKKLEIDSYEGLYKYYEELKDYKEAFFYYKQYASLSDSIFNEEVSKRMSEILSNAEIEKREKEKDLLQEQIRRKDFENKALIGGAIFLLLFAVYFFNTTQQKKRTNKLLSEQNAEINRKQRQIISINESLQRSQKQLHKVNEKLQILNEGLENTVKERTYELQKSHQELDTFLYQSSHALRRPIVNILGLVQIARIEPDQTNVPAIYDKIDDTASRMDLMLKKLVMVSEINLAEQQLEPIDFDRIISECIALLGPELLEKKVRLNKRIQDVNGFKSDKRLMSIIFQNILENSITFYSKCDGQEACININVHENNASVDINFRDNGIGIPEEMVNNIFEMFHVATTRSKGYGLGLYIVRKAVEKLNGKINLESKEHEYTDIKISLPYNPLIKMV